MVTSLLKKKKKVFVKSYFNKNQKRRSRWSSKAARSLNKKVATKWKNVNLIKRKNKVSPHKKYKNFLTPIERTTCIKSVGDGKAAIGMVAFKCLSSCKMNFSTMAGIKKKSEILKKNIRIWFRKFPNKQLTRKSTGHRMGKGKGKFSARVAIYKKGEVILEASYLDRGVFDNYYKSLIKSLPVPVVTIYKSKSFQDCAILASASVKNFKRSFK